MTRKGNGMDAAKMQPITWNAVDYEPGDRFAVAPQFHTVYEIKERRERGTLVEFEAAFAVEGDREEHGRFTFTFPSDFPLSARRRIRTITAPCTLCDAIGRHELDTAYTTYNAAVCGEH